jgi:predicted dehydrogenase
MIRLGIIGTGAMAATHAERFSSQRGVQLAACCDSDAAKARRFARRWSIPRPYADYREMLGIERLDAVAVVTADAMHAPISLAAIARGLAVLCEKPLATSLDDAREMRDAAVRAGATTMINFSYRSSAGVWGAASFIARGGIGRVLHVEASYLQSWLVQDLWGDWRTDPAFTWRLSRAHGSAGALGDIGCHLYDLVAFLCGDIAEVSCRLATFDKRVKGSRIGPFALDANDGFVSRVTFAAGGIGAVHATRWATGQINSLRVRAYGDEGAVQIDLDRDPSLYRVIRGKRAARAAEWREVRCGKTPSMYERFVRSIRTGGQDECDFAAGARVQAYLEASFRSDAEGHPVKVIP